MLITFEISRPFQAKPDYFKSRITSFSFCWLWFRLTVHPLRLDELLRAAAEGDIEWSG